jgi:hypothetical protein
MSGIISFLSINGQEITEQGRKVSDSYDFGASNVELNSGINKRYIRNSKRTFAFQWEWMPSLQEKTIDNRKARDYVKQIAFLRSKAQMVIQLHPSEPSESLDVYVNDYSETLVRRSPQEGCDYYSVSLTVEEV